MQFIVVIFFVIIAMVVIKSVQSEKTKSSWSKAAQQMGLRFNPGGFLERPTITGFKSEHQIEVSMFSKRSGKHTRIYTRFRVYYPYAFGMGLHIYQEGFFTQIAKFFGGQDMQVGDRVFDEIMRIQGNEGDRELILSLLDAPCRQKILKLMGKYPGLKINDHNIKWEARGRIQDSYRLKSIVYDFLDLSLSLQGDEMTEVDDEEKPVQEQGQALGPYTPQLEGILPESPKVVPPFPPPPPLPDAEERVVLEDPDVPEEHVVPEASTFQEASVHPDVADEGIGPATSEVIEGPDAAAVCDHLFADQGLSHNPEAIFSEHYAGKPIQWSGVLQSASAYSFDFTFGDKAGVKGKLIIHETEKGLYGEKKIAAEVAFPPEQLDALKGNTGQTIVFQGELMKVDTFTRTLYVTGGRLA